jgi:hypothetical protein
MNTTRRNNGIRLFYDDSNRKIDKQAIGNMLKDIFDQIDSPLTLQESNGTIHGMIKKAFGMERTVSTNDLIALPSDSGIVSPNDNV